MIEKENAKMIGVYVGKDVLGNLKSLAHRREVSLSELVRGVMKRELSQAVQSGEWVPRETPKAEVMGV
jgi:hypothetical protein